MYIDEIFRNGKYFLSMDTHVQRHLTVSVCGEQEKLAINGELTNTFWFIIFQIMNLWN